MYSNENAYLVRFLNIRVCFLNDFFKEVESARWPQFADKDPKSLQKRLDAKKPCQNVEFDLFDKDRHCKCVQ